MLVKVFPVTGIDPLFVSLYMWQKDEGSFDDLKKKLR